jgi:uncharacterized DUF497 family protein
MSSDFEWFEWDDRKRTANLEKHRIDFRDVVQALTAPYLAVPSPRHGEDRWIAIVPVEGRLIAVIYTFRDGRCRIVSARAARRNERKAYHANLGRGAS